MRTAANGRSYYIARNATGDKAIRVMAIRFHKAVTIPLEIAGLAAGPDAWLRDCTAMCKACKELTPISELHGTSDLPGHCEKCAADYFTCVKCKGQHHPDDECPAATVTDGKAVSL